MATDEGITVNIDFGESRQKFTEVILQQRMAEKRIYDNKDSHLRLEVPSKILFEMDEEKKKAEAEVRKILQNIAVSDSNDQHEPSKKIVFGNERRPFDFTWWNRPRPTLTPSPMFYFANLDDIRRRMQCNEDPVNMCVTYRYQRNNVVCMSDFDILDPIIRSHYDDGTLEKTVVRQLAKQYDEVIMKEVVKMPMNNFENLKRAVYAADGDIEFESSMDMRTRAIVTLRIPMNNLNPFYMMLLNGKTDTPKPTTIPDIKDIKIQNNMVVVVYFEDGSFTKSICKDGDTFNVYTGVMVCLFKRMLGKDDGQKKFTRLMEKAMGFFTRKEKELKKAREEKKARVAAQKAREEKNLRKKSKKREEQISIFAEALKRDRQAAAWENRPETSNDDI